MNATTKIFLRTDQQNVNGSNSVYLRLTIKRISKIFSLNIAVFPKHWNSQVNQVKKADEKHLIKNKYLAKYQSKAQNILADYFLNDKILTFNKFREELFNYNSSETDFYKFVENEMNNRVYAKETLKGYKSVFTKMKNYKKKLDINDIDKTFIDKFKKHLITKYHNNFNTWNKNLRVLKAFLNMAIDKELIAKNPFDKIKLSSRQGNKVALNSKELDILRDLLNTNKLSKSEKTTLEYFLFACYTGLRYGDIKDLKFKNIKKDLVSLIMHKTKILVEIPLINKSRKLIKQFNLPNKKVFDVACSQVTNRRLKTIMKIANIDKQISFHCARHTLATEGFILGIPAPVIQKILGHTDIKTTLIYLKIPNELKAKELQKFE